MGESVEYIVGTVLDELGLTNEEAVELLVAAIKHIAVEPHQLERAADLLSGY